MGERVYEDAMRKLNDDHLVKGKPHPFVDEKTALCGISVCWIPSHPAGHRGGGHGLTFLKQLCKIMYDNGKHMTWITEIGFRFICIMSKRSGIVSRQFYNRETTRSSRRKLR